MKTMLFLHNNPVNCYECEMCGGHDYERVCCTYEFAGEDVSEYDTGLPMWCPLRHTPKRKQADLYNGAYHVGRDHGWNMCLDEIEGERTRDLDNAEKSFAIKILKWLEVNGDDRKILQETFGEGCENYDDVFGLWPPEKIISKILDYEEEKRKNDRRCVKKSE